MKKRMMIIGIVSLAFLFGLVLMSCDNPATGPSYGTVIVKNLSPAAYSSDAIVYIDVSDAVTTSALGSSYVYRNQQVTFTNVPTGKLLRVYVIDMNYNIYKSSDFTLSKGQTKSFKYTGLSIVAEN